MNDLGEPEQTSYHSSRRLKRVPCAWVTHLSSGMGLLRWSCPRWPLPATSDRGPRRLGGLNLPPPIMLLGDLSRRVFWLLSLRLEEASDSADGSSPVEEGIDRGGGASGPMASPAYLNRGCDEVMYLQA